MRAQRGLEIPGKSFRKERLGKDLTDTNSERPAGIRRKGLSMA